MYDCGLTAPRSQPTFVQSRCGDACGTRTHAVPRREPPPALAIPDKGKPVVRRGRKAMGLVPLTPTPLPHFGGEGWG
jgi:hypothetical protein